MLTEPLIRYDDATEMPYLHDLISFDFEIPGVVTRWDQIDHMNIASAKHVVNPLYGYKFK